MGLALQEAGLAVLRLNLRGAGPGRHLAPGTYAARCSSDLLPVIAQARQLAEALGHSAGGGAALPLLGAGISLGGTMLLNACLDGAAGDAAGRAAVLDGLVCISSPLDLAACSRCIERPRNRVYQNWLLRRLCHQTLEDPSGCPPRSGGSWRAAPAAARSGASMRRSRRRAGIRLGGALLRRGQPPAAAAGGGAAAAHPAGACPRRPLGAGGGTRQVAARHPSGVQVVLTARGGHNGFHGRGDPRRAPVPSCWGDQLVARWLGSQLPVASAADGAARA